MAKKGIKIVVSGPSAAGKSTIVARALDRLSKEMPIERLVTYTTRPHRPTEEQGKDYIFTSRSAFEQKEKEGFFLETAEYAGNKYGSPVADESELELGKSFVYVVELKGAKEIKSLYKDALMIWVEAPSMEILKNRLKKRGVTSESDFKRRVTQSEEDMIEAHKIRIFDYFLVNDVFEQAVEEFMLLIKRALQD